MHERPRSSCNNKRLPTVETNSSPRWDTIFPISPLLFLRKFTSSSPYDLIVEELEELTRANAAHSVTQCLGKPATKVPAAAKKNFLKNMTSDFQKAHRNLHISSELLASFLEEENIFGKTVTLPLVADGPTTEPLFPPETKELPLPETSMLPPPCYSIFSKHTIRAVVMETAFKDFANHQDLSLQFLLVIKGTSNTELWALRAEHVGPVVDRISKRPFSLIDPLLIPRVSFMEGSSQTNMHSEKSTLLWKETAQPIMEISRAPSTCSVPVLGIRTSYSVQIFSIPTKISKWNSLLWWSNNGRITPDVINEYIAIKMQKDPRCSLLSLKISPRVKGDFAVLCSDLTIIEWSVGDGGDKSRLHSYDLCHLVVNKKETELIPIIFEYSLQEGRFWIAIGECFLLLKCDQQAEVIGKISEGVPFLFLPPLGEVIRGDTDATAGASSVPGILSISNEKVFVDQLVSFPTFSEWRTTHCWSLDYLTGTSHEHRHTSVRLFHLSVDFFGIVIWDKASQEIQLAILPTTEFSSAPSKVAIRIPAVKSGVGWGFRNGSAVSTALPVCFTTTQRNAFLVDVAPLCFPGNGYVDVHFLQYYSDHEIYLISYRWLSHTNSSSISLPTPFPGASFEDLQRSLSAVPRYTFELPFEGFKQWSYRSAFKVGLSKSNFRKKHTVVGIFSWFKLFLLLTLGGNFTGDQSYGTSLHSFQDDMPREDFVEFIKSDLVAILQDLGTSKSSPISDTSETMVESSRKPFIACCSLNELRQRVMRSQLKRISRPQKRCTFYLLYSLLDEVWPQLLSLIRQFREITSRNDPIIKFKLSHIAYLLTEHQTKQQSAADKDGDLHAMRRAFLKLVGLPDTISLTPTFEGCKDRTSSAISLAAVTDSLFFSLSEITRKEFSQSADRSALSLELSETEKLKMHCEEKLAMGTTIQTELSDLWEHQMLRTVAEREIPDDPNLLKIRNIFRRQDLFCFSQTSKEPSSQSLTTQQDPLLQNLIFSSQESYASSQLFPTPFSSQPGLRFLSHSQKSLPLTRPAIVPRTNRRSGFR